MKEVAFIYINWQLRWCYVHFTQYYLRILVIKTHVHVCVTMDSSGRVYAVGGHDGSEHLGNMEMFDPLTNKWMMKASMNTKRYQDNAESSILSLTHLFTYIHIFILD